MLEDVQGSAQKLEQMKNLEDDVNSITIEYQKLNEFVKTKEKEIEALNKEN